MGQVAMGGERSLAGVVVQPLDIVRDARGDILRMLRSDNPLFGPIHEVYFSYVNPGVIKAWKRHLLMTQRFAVPVGMIELILFDERDDSSTRGQLQVVQLGIESYSLIVIPPLVWYGFRGLSENPAMIVNCADMRHDPNEIERREPDSAAIPFCWK